jgi:hypothetical protein
LWKEKWGDSFQIWFQFKQFFFLANCSQVVFLGIETERHPIFGYQERFFSHE